MEAKRIVISLGDPGGIGTEVTLKAISHFRKKLFAKPHRFILIGSLPILDYLNKKFRTGLKFRTLSPNRVNKDVQGSDREIPVFDLPGTDLFLKKASRMDFSIKKNKAIDFSIGKISAINGLLAIESVNWAVNFCLKGLADALVTAPLNKAAVQSVIPRFDGHTEYLRIRSGSKRVAMMFVADRLKMTLVTMHLPLKEVSKALSQKLVQEKIELTYDGLKNLFGIKHPHIGVSALNPHGSEFGIEESKIIVPSVKKCSKKIPNLAGPIPGDEIFRELWEGKWDAVVAMYHDQGLAPFKMIAFRHGVNLTLGLPFIRTSPDHGTAFDIAFQNKADYQPMLSAIELAIKLADKKR